MNRFDAWRGAIGALLLSFSMISCTSLPEPSAKSGEDAGMAQFNPSHADDAAIPIEADVEHDAGPLEHDARPPIPDAPATAPDAGVAKPDAAPAIPDAAPAVPDTGLPLNDAPPSLFALEKMTVGIAEDAVRYLAGAVPAVKSYGVPPLQAPVYNASKIDPTFGTSIRRISSPAFGIHDYSQLQAISYDNEYILIAEGVAEGNADYLIRRISDLKTVMSGSQLPEWNCARWHPQKKSKIVHFDSNADTTLRVQLTDVETSTTQTIFTFPASYERIRGNQSFDEISRDGQWLAGLATNSSGGQTIFSFNIDKQQLAVEIDFDTLFTSGTCAEDPTWGRLDPDWIGVSPLGNYLMVQWAASGTNRCQGLESFDINTGAFVGRVTADHPHADLQVLADGKTEVFVSAEFSGPPAGTNYVNGTPSDGNWDSNYPAMSYRVLPGPANGEAQSQYLYLTDWVFEHISCRGPAGYCLVTAHNNPANGTNDPLENELFLLKLDGSGIVRLAHHRSSGSSYWQQPRASFSGDGRFVVFDSDWASDTAVYLIDLSVGASGTP
jgi:hypothetical protein